MEPYLIFSDESGYDGDNQFGCLAKISGSRENTKALNQELKIILQKHRKEEFKFKEIKNGRTIQIAKDFINVTIEFLKSSKIKLHILVWDKKDSRHQVYNRCDIENLKRMYFHHLKAIKKHWRIDTNWEFYPDEFSAINWAEDVVKYLENTTIKPVKSKDQIELFESFSGIKIKYQKVKELSSKDYPIIQLADLYAGLIRTARAESETFFEWYQKKKFELQPSFFDYEQNLQPSNTLSLKFEVMYHFKKRADDFRLGVNLSKLKYFSSLNSKSNINIWHYEPQGDYDKAPTKNNRSHS